MTDTHSTWPHPTDSPTARARKVALSYRQLLANAIDKNLTPDQLAKELATHDQLMRSYGQYWATPTTAAWDDDEWVPSTIAGEILGVTDSRVSQYRITGKIHGRRDGRAYLFNVGELRALKPTLHDARRAAREAFRTQNRNNHLTVNLTPDNQADTVPTNGSTVE